MRALVVRVPSEEAEVAADVLWSLGVVAVEERSARAGLVELWTSVGESVEALTTAGEVLAGRWEWSTIEVDDAVVDTWRAYAQPVVVDDGLVVLPAWLDERPQTWSAAAEVLVIEPGSTFGLGDHPTTRLSLLAVRREVARAPGSVVLDVGCGSGILAIAAVRFGAAHAVGVDIAPAAVDVGAENARRNGVADHVEVSTAPLAVLSGPYRIVVANILAPALLELAPDLERLVADDGVLIISGLLEGRYDQVLEALTPLTTARVDTCDGWVAVTLVRR